MPTNANTSTLHFSNPGEINPDLFKLFGVSAKENDNPVGYFGTGLKYAIAILLREQHTITIFSGLDEYVFTTEQRQYRGSDHQIVLCNGKELSFTLDLGKNWKLWQAYRELYSNCVLDENGFAAIGAGTPSSGETLIRVSGRNIVNIHHKRHEIFLESTPIISNEKLSVHEGQSNFLYYRGIRACKLDLPTQYTYNLIEKEQLTEDRTLASQWGFQWWASVLIAQSQNRDFIKKSLSSDAYEKQFLDYSRSTTASDVFCEIASEVLRTHIGEINPTIQKTLVKFKEIDPWRTIEMTPSMELKLERAKAICGKLHMPANAPIRVVDSLGQNVLGMAQNGTVYIADAAFDLGTKTVAATLYEELIHLNRGYSDLSRGMQNFLFGKIFTLYEELTGEEL